MTQGPAIQEDDPGPAVPGSSAGPPAGEASSVVHAVLSLYRAHTKLLA